MLTNIDLDEKLVAEARRLTGLKTKKAVVEAGLRALIQLNQQVDVRQLWGRLHWQDPAVPAAAPEEKGKSRAGRR